MLNKKGNALTIILVILLGAFIVFQLVDLASRECGTDSDCSPDSYCGSDFTCHQFKTVERTVNSYNLAATILGLSIIIGALILKWGKLKDFKVKKEKMPKLQTYYEKKSPSNYSEHHDPLKQKYKKSDH